MRVDVATTEPLRLTLCVADNGIGMAPEAIGRLFMPFAQAETSTTRRFGGTGLGLAICKRVVDLMAGEIAVDSSPGAGSRFTVTLPLEAVDAVAAAALPDLHGLDCIVIEGVDLDADAASAYLEHAGARVRKVNGIGAALRAAADIDALVVVIQNAGLSLGRNAGRAHSHHQWRTNACSAPPS